MAGMGRGEGRAGGGDIVAIFSNAYHTNDAPADVCTTPGIMGTPAQAKRSMTEWRMNIPYMVICCAYTNLVKFPSSSIKASPPSNSSARKPAMD